ncbi:MAG: energy transducer TonB, partial [Bacteroidales bacterium]|nr:energy transducer TonB [Bacteroidales bacterium]
MKKLLLIVCLSLAAVIASAQPRQLTVKEFLKLSEQDTTSYIVKGVVTKIRSVSSGSFYITDGTGELLVYRILDPANPGRDFKQMDIVQSDTVAVLGRFTIYNGTTKEMKDGRLLSKADGPDHNLSFMDRLDRQPSFKGKKGQEGLDAFSKWVQKRIQKPADGATGTVLVRFVIGRNGGVQEVQIARGVSPALNDEAMRVVR